MPNVTIYTTPWCVFCRMTKEYFKQHDIKYTEKDVGSDLRARDEMIQKSGQLGVPVIDVDNQIIIGFDQEKLAELLAIKH